MTWSDRAQILTFHGRKLALFLLGGTPMPGRAVAALLIVLTFLPFTAPFATCDARTLFDGATPVSGERGASSHTLEHDGYASQVVPTPAMGSRAKLAMFAVSRAMAERSAPSSNTPPFAVRLSDVSPCPVSRGVLRI